MPTKEYEDELFSSSPPSLHGPAARAGRLRHALPHLECSRVLTRCLI